MGERDRLLARIRDRMPQLWKRVYPTPEDLRCVEGEQPGAVDRVEYPLPGYPDCSLRWAPQELLLRQVCPECGHVFLRGVADTGSLLTALSCGWPQHLRTASDGRRELCPLSGRDF